MREAWADAATRIGGRRAVSLTAYAFAFPFWVFGFLFNEDVTYESWGNALTVFVIASVAQLGLGAVFLLGHLTILRHRSITPVELWKAVLVWGVAGGTRAALLIAGLTITGIDNDISTPQRIVFSVLMAIVGFGIAAYALDVIDSFTRARADVLKVLLQGEEQLSAHRAAVLSMRDAMVANVDRRLKKSQAQIVAALDQLEDSLTSPSVPQPALDELRTLSDSTWQRISQELWNTAPQRAPRIRVGELLDIYASSRPFRLLYFPVLSFFLYTLVYSRVFDAATGAVLVGLWVIAALGWAALGNGILPRLQKFRIAAFLAMVLVFLSSSAPLLLLASSWGFEPEHPWRVASVHALSVFIAVVTSLPQSVATARDRILAGLKNSLDATTLEKLHVESQLKVVSHKIASRLHGDVRGNFLSAILKLQDHIQRRDVTLARQEIQTLRAILQDSQGTTPLKGDPREDLEKFINNWGALVDVSLDQPLSGVPDPYLDAVHTIIVDAVNNAVRHGKANWIRIGFHQEPEALLLTVQNNGEPHQGTRSGLGTTHLDLFAPDRWSLLRNAQGMTQLLVRLEESTLPQESLSI